METTQGISLCSYLHLKLAKMPWFSFYLVFSSTKLENKRAEGGEEGRMVTQIMYTHVSKCKKDKITFKLTKNGEVPAEHEKAGGK
jgi:hypothetical protein